MSVDLLTSFSEAASQTFKLLLDLEVSTEANNELSDEEKKDNLNITIQITGDISGEVMYSFPKDTTLEIVKIMSGMEFNEIDEFVKSALGEVANIISGNALTELSQNQFACDIRPPQIKEDGRLEAAGSTIYQAKVKTPIGDVDLKLRTIG